MSKNNNIRFLYVLLATIATLSHRLVHTASINDVAAAAATAAAATTTSISYRDRVIGCLFSDVCNEDQICFDDNVFGRCEELNPKTGTFLSSYVYQLDRKTLQLLERELNRLSDEDFTWNSPYTQCILKTILNDRPRTVYDPVACDYLRSLTTERQETEQQLQLGELEEDEPTVVASSHDGGAVVAGDSDIFNSDKLDSIWNVYSRQQLQQQPRRASSSSKDTISSSPSTTSSILSSPSQSSSSYQINSAKIRQQFHNNNNNNNINNNVPLSDQSVHSKLRSNLLLKRTEAAIKQQTNIGKSREQLSDSPASPNTDVNNNNNQRKRENGLLLQSLFGKLPANFRQEQEDGPNSELDSNAESDLYKVFRYNNKANDDDDDQNTNERRQKQDQVANYIQFMVDNNNSPYIKNSKFANEQMGNSDGDDENEEQLLKPYLKSYYSAVDSRTRPLSFQPGSQLEEEDDGNNLNDDNQLYVVDGPIGNLVGNNPEIRVLREVDDDDEENNIPEIIDVSSSDNNNDDDNEPLILLDVTDNEDQPNTAANDDDPSILATLIDSMITEQDQHLRKNPNYDIDDQNLSSEVEVEDDDNDSGDKDLKEILFGDINYNNNYDSVRPNFYREHRYDIKKPGPKYFEEYFFTDLIDNNGNVNDDKSNDNNKKRNYDRMAYHPKNPNTNPIGSANNLDLPPMKKDNTNNNNNNKNKDKNEPGTNIMSSKPVAEGPVKVDSKSENSIIIRSAEVGEETSLEAIDSTHTYIVIDKILGEEESQRFIQILEQVFKLPRGTFSNLRKEDFQITFKVNPNYRDLNASQIASRIEDLSKQLKKITGYYIKETGIGDKAKLPVLSAMIIKKSNEKFINLTLLICSVILAIISAAFVIFLFKRNAKFREKIKYFMKNAEDLTKLDYQDLCRQRMQGKGKDTDNDPEKANLTKSDEEEASKLKNIDTNLANQQAPDNQVSGSPGSRSSTSSWVEEPVSSNMDITTGHIILSYMEDHLKKKDRLNREWEALCAYEADPCSTNSALQKQNSNKNRYPDILPYDHSRVILNDSTNANHSDYINANTITDHDPRNPAYIVTQGPLTNTKADFWQMVWEQGSVIIVMLTRLRENGLSMCDRYWPEEGSEKFQNYEVHLVSEHIWCDDYLVRSFYLKNLKTGETRTVTQFHFLSWPENGIPPNTKSILDFRRKINKSYKGRSCPIVVHCSDGIGRTGTYILIDMVLNRMAKGAKEIDIAATLEHIRDQRAGIVKNKAQFEFVLLAVAEEVQAILKALSANN